MFVGSEASVVRSGFAAVSVRAPLSPMLPVLPLPSNGPAGCGRDLEDELI